VEKRRRNSKPQEAIRTWTTPRARPARTHGSEGAVTVGLTASCGNGVSNEGRLYPFLDDINDLSQ
jgi:hypothetical protein